MTDVCKLCELCGKAEAITGGRSEPDYCWACWKQIKPRESLADLRYANELALVVYRGPRDQEAFDDEVDHQLHLLRKRRRGA